MLYLEIGRRENAFRCFAPSRTLYYRLLIAHSPVFQMPKGLAHLRNANLNLVPILAALLREANVSRAAASLGLSQSATSGALARLRLLLGDPLLVQVGRLMRLTPRAEELVVPIERLVASLGDLLSSTPFNPMEAERRFIVATPDYTGFLIGNRLIDLLRETAPMVSVYFIDVPPKLPERLNAGDVDLAIVDINRSAWAGLSSQPIFSDQMVWILSRQHPLASKSRLTLEEVNSFPNLHWQSNPVRSPPANMIGHRTDHAQLVMQQFTVLPLLALESQCVAMVPKMLGDRMAEILPLKTIEIPDHGRTLHGGLLWSPVQDVDPAHRWFRGLIAQIFDRNGSSSA